jgi:DNA end-binding protein Ku
MARQLVEMLADDFEPERHHDGYRARVQALIATKAGGGKAEPAPRQRPAPIPDLSRALEASLREVRRRA